LMVFSDIVNFNNTFCAYDGSKEMISDLFARHIYYPKSSPAENNVWGTKLGRGSFSGYFEKSRKGILFMSNTFERLVVGSKTVTVMINDSVEGKLARNFND
jgi:putative DNA methylase